MFFLRVLWGRGKYFFNVYLWKPLKKSLSYYLPFRNTLPERKRNQQAAQLRKKPDTFSMTVIGRIKSVYMEKFGTPRQGSLVPEGRGCLVLDKRAVDPYFALESLHEFSHIWLIFVFHANHDLDSTSSKVRPPNFGGNKIGVFATRSPHRPSPVGLSLAKIDRVDVKRGEVHLTGLDLCNGTPVIDIKPYCEHVDWPGANQSEMAAWLKNPKFDLAPVQFEPDALSSLQYLVEEKGIMEWYTKQEFDVVKLAIEQVIALDPRDLNRGRGAFSGSENNAVALPVKETSFTRREEKLRKVSTERMIYLRFDRLNIWFRPALDGQRGFVVTKVERFV